MRRVRPVLYWLSLLVLLMPRVPEASVLVGAAPHEAPSGGLIGPAQVSSATLPTARARQRAVKILGGRGRSGLLTLVPITRSSPRHAATPCLPRRGPSFDGGFGGFGLAAGPDHRIYVVGESDGTGFPQQDAGQVGGYGGGTTDNLYRTGDGSGHYRYTGTVSIGTWPSSFPSVTGSGTPGYLLYATASGSTAGTLGVSGPVGTLDSGDNNGLSASPITAGGRALSRVGIV